MEAFLFCTFRDSIRGAAYAPWSAAVADVHRKSALCRSSFESLDPLIKSQLLISPPSHNRCASRYNLSFNSLLRAVSLQKTTLSCFLFTTTELEVQMAPLLGEQGKTVDNCFDDAKSAEREWAEPSLRRR